MQASAPESPGSPPSGDGAEARSRAPEARFAFLARSSRILAETLDYEETLGTVASLALPHLGAWCIVDVCEGDVLRRLTVVHPDPLKAAVARELHERYPPSTDDVLGVRRVIRSGRPEVVTVIRDEEIRARARDGRHLDLLRKLGISSYMVVPLEARGEILGAMTFVTGEDGRRFGEWDIALAEDLARRSALAIDNARLYRKAQEALRSKSDFLAMISHELRTPLHAIVGWAGLLAAEVEGGLTSPQQKGVQRIVSSARHLEGLVDELLAFADVERGRLVLSGAELDVAGQVEGALRVVRSEALLKGLDVRADCPGELRFHSDRRVLRQVLVNLLTNAVSYTPAGKVVVRARREAEGDLLLEVSDTGVGMGADQLRHVYEAFWQGERSLTRRHPGIGIGLSLTRRLVQAMGGQMALESEPGQGTTIRVRLPPLP